MNKNTLKLLESCVDSGNPRVELNFAFVDFENNMIFATDARRAVIVYLQDDDTDGCSGVHYLHKKVLKAIITMCDLSEEYIFVNNCLLINGNKVSVSNGFSREETELKYPDLLKVANREYEDEYTADNIHFLEFDLTHKNTYINFDYLKKVQELGQADQYRISSSPQRKEENSVGIVKVQGFIDNFQVWDYIVNGVEYKPQQPSLFDFGNKETT